MDIKEIREDFPLIEEIIYLDSACMTLRPKQVIEKINEYYLEYPVCVSRSKHWLADKLSKEIKDTREKIKNLISASKKDEIVFLRNSSEGLNLIAKGFPFEKGDLVLISEKEHNSNLIPWLKLKKKGIIELKVVKTKEGFIDLDYLFEILEKEDVKLASFVTISNLDGLNTLKDEKTIKKISKKLHENNAFLVIDGAQTIGHEEFFVNDLDIDFLVFSLHKMCGPSGIGVLYGKYDLLNKIEPLNSGGSTVEDSNFEDFKELKPPYKFEAGLQDYAGIVGSKAAVEYIKKIGLKKISKHCQKLGEIVFDELEKFIDDKIKVINTKKENVNNIFNFYFLKDKEKNNSLINKLNEVLSKNKIAVRAGKHCVHGYYNKYYLPYSIRASWYFYNTEEEILQFTKIIKEFIAKYLT